MLLAVWILQIVGCLFFLRKQKLSYNLLISGLLFLSFQALYCLPFTFNRDWFSPISYTKQLLDAIPTLLLAYIIYKFKALDESSFLIISAIVFTWVLQVSNIFSWLYSNYEIEYWPYSSLVIRLLFCILAFSVARRCDVHLSL